MHERHDLELIAAYADGSLASGSEEARRLVASCPECAEEFRIQTEIRSMLATAPIMRMSDDERLRVRERALAAVAPEAAAAPAGRTARDGWMRRWVAIGTVAAALFVAVGIAGPLGDVLDGGDDTAEDGAAFLTATDELDSSAATGGALAAEEAQREMAAEDGAEGDAGIASLVPPEEPLAAVVDLGPVDEMTVFEWIERVMSDVETRMANEPGTVVLTPETFGERERPVPECFGAVDGPVVGVITAELDGMPLEVFLFLEESGALASETFAVDGCESRPLP